jgi:hypothetical protein
MKECRYISTRKCFSIRNLMLTDPPLGTAVALHLSASDPPVTPMRHLSHSAIYAEIFGHSVEFHKAIPMSFFPEHLMYFSGLILDTIFSKIHP